MCATCGCSSTHDEHGHLGAAGPHAHDHGRHEAHEHDHDRGHRASGTDARGIVRLEQEILTRNARQAESNRRLLTERRIVALNLMGSPGAGKTSLLERTVHALGRDATIEVIEGDQETDRDARRLRETGCAVVQLNTGTGCHLDAAMVARGLQSLELVGGSLLVIENVGNLVCPALFDLGEHVRVVVSSLAEGEDKPVKYPHMFRAASVIVLNKMDLMPHVGFDLRRFLEHARQVNPRAAVIPLSATRGDGVDDWLDWLRGQAPHGWA